MQLFPIARNALTSDGIERGGPLLTKVEVERSHILPCLVG